MNNEHHNPSKSWWSPQSDIQNQDGTQCVTKHAPPLPLPIQ